MLGVTPGLFGDHWVSGSLGGVMYAPLDVLVVLVCTACIAFSCSLSFLGSPNFPLYFYSLIYYSPGKFSIPFS